MHVRDVDAPPVRLGARRAVLLGRYGEIWGDMGEIWGRYGEIWGARRAVLLRVHGEEVDLEPPSTPTPTPTPSPTPTLNITCVYMVKKLTSSPRTF